VWRGAAGYGGEVAGKEKTTYSDVVQFHDGGWIVVVEIGEGGLFGLDRG
jgi:hypothetical protein